LVCGSVARLEFEVVTLDVAAAPVKPRLRGVWHLWAFVVAIPVGVVLGLAAGTTRERVAASVFAGSVVAMFGASALYHRARCGPAGRRWLRRLDHAGVFGLIAGTYTPFGLLVLSGAWRITVLAIVWGGVLAAIALRFVWISAPEWISASIGVALGWVGVVVFPQILEKTGLLGALLVLGGGLSYTLGALIYARRKPDPFPTVFGFHELFHALTILAVGLQYAAVGFAVLPRV
jgi:hemolysin III